MPLNRVVLTPGAYAGPARHDLVVRITEAAAAAESLPMDNPDTRRRSLVMLEELPAGGMFWGGEVLDERLRAVFVDFFVSAGVLDAARKARFTAALQAAAEAASPADETRPVTTMVIFHEVPEGSWGRAGAIWRLPQIAHAAHLAHLADIAEPAR